MYAFLSTFEWNIVFILSFYERTGAYEIGGIYQTGEINVLLIGHTLTKLDKM